MSSLEMFSGLPWQYGKAVGIIPANSQMKCVGEKQYSVLASTDSPALACGLSVISAPDGGDITFVPIGLPVYVASDGTTNIVPGDFVTSSASVNGYVATGTPAVGIAFTEAASGSGGLVGVFWFGGVGSQSANLWFSVTSYGAAGDGITDDGPAFQRAFNAVSIHGGIVYVPPGTYRIATPVLGVFGNAGAYVEMRGAGAASRIYVDVAEDEIGITINDTPGAPRIGVTSLAFIGNLDALAPSVAQCYVALLMGGTQAAGHYIRNVQFVKVRAAGDVVYMGNGAGHILVEDCDWIACDALFGTANVDPQSLLDLDVIMGATVRNCRFTSSDMFDGTVYGSGGARSAIKFRRYNVPDGLYDGSQVLIERCSFVTPAVNAILCLQPNGLPNSPSSQVFLQGIVSGGKIPTGQGVWDMPTGTPSGGYVKPYSMEIRIDSAGVAGVATWSTRFEDAGFGGGWTAWTSHGNAASATVNGILLAMGAGTFQDSSTYVTYITGPMRVAIVKISQCFAITGGTESTHAVQLAECDRVIIEQLEVDASSTTRAVTLWDCDVVKIVQPWIHAHKIVAENGAFGFADNAYVFVEDPNATAVLDLSNATASQTYVKGVFTGP